MDRIFQVERERDRFFIVDRDGAWHRLLLRGADIFGGYDLGAPVDIGPGGPGGAGAADGLRIVAPVRPSKIVCVGLNYKDHAAEVRKPLPAEPLLFLKPSTSVLDPGAPILLPPGVGRVDYEGELAMVIGRRAHRVSRKDAWSHVFGLTCVNDVTARDLQDKESQYTRCKGFDTFAPIGPCISVGATSRPRTIETRVNGATRQSSSSAQLIFDLEHLVEFITFVMTLLPGDVISTGTPPGIGGLADGDTVTIAVEGIGELTNPVQAESL